MSHRFDHPVPTLPPELLEKVIAAGKRFIARRNSHTRIDPTPAGALLSLSELLATVAETRPFPDGPEGTIELVDASGTRLGTTTAETAQRLWPTQAAAADKPE